MQSIDVAGKTYKLRDVASSSAVLPSELDLLREVVDSIKDDDAEVRSLPALLTLDGKTHDLANIRTWLAVGIGESSSWISDLDVLRVVAKGGLYATEEPYNPSKLPSSFPEPLDRLRDMLDAPKVAKEAKRIQSLYRGERGLMVVDVVASRQRKYKSGVEGRILPAYRTEAPSLGLEWLSNNSPNFLRLRSNEADTMRELARFLLQFSQASDDEKTISEFVKASDRASIRAQAIAIKGIGPVLYEYLRLLAGADTIKIDSRVRASLRQLGFPQHYFSDQGLLELCKGLASSLGCSLVELDQALWNNDLVNA